MIKTLVEQTGLRQSWLSNVSVRQACASSWQPDEVLKMQSEVGEMRKREGHKEENSPQSRTAAENITHKSRLSVLMMFNVSIAALSQLF